MREFSSRHFYTLSVLHEKKDNYTDVILGFKFDKYPI